MNIIKHYPEVTFTCIFTSLSEIEEKLKMIFKTRLENNKFTLEYNRLNLKKFYRDYPFYGGTTLKNAIIFSPSLKNQLSLFISNRQDGWHTLVNKLSNNMKCDIIRITLSKDYVNYPCNLLEYFKNGKSVRLVRSMVDEKLEFFQRGVLMNFEDPKNYKKRKIKDRLNQAILIEYLKKLDWDLNNDDLWKSDTPALYLEETELNRKNN